jgi:hypothetical protein
MHLQNKIRVLLSTRNQHSVHTHGAAGVERVAYDLPDLDKNAPTL